MNSFFENAAREAEQNRNVDLAERLRATPTFVAFLRRQAEARKPEVAMVARNILSFIERSTPEIIQNSANEPFSHIEIAESPESFAEMAVEKLALAGFYHPIFLGDRLLSKDHVRYNARCSDPAYFGGQWEIISQRLEGITGRNFKDRLVLDIGASDGYFSVRSALAGARCVATDVFPTNGLTIGSYAAINGVADRVTYLYAALEWIDPNQPPFTQFDTIFALGLLYHLEDLKAGVEKLAAFKKPLVIEGLAIPESEDRGVDPENYVRHTPISFNWLTAHLQAIGYVVSEIPEWTEFSDRFIKDGATYRMLIATPR